MQLGRLVLALLPQRREWHNALEDPAGQLWSDSALIVGQSWGKLQNGETRILRQSSDGTIKVERPPGGGGASGLPHRTSWRELAD